MPRHLSEIDMNELLADIRLTPGIRNAFIRKGILVVEGSVAQAELRRVGNSALLFCRR